jgi:uncharacterized protein
MQNESVRTKPQVGIGFRHELAAASLENADAFDIFEFTPENYLGVGGVSRVLLERAAATLPLLAHGVSVSIGSTDDLNWHYIRQIKSLLDEFKIPWFSDHLCYSSIDGLFLNDLLPLPFVNSEIKRIAERIKRVQEFIGCPFLLENISYYVDMPGTMPEAEFLASILETADCGLLLDVNNLYVNSRNHKYDPVEFLSIVPIERTVEVHMAGHSSMGEMLIDNHGNQMIPEVYSLLDRVLQRVSVKAIILERDKCIPPIEELIEETISIRRICDKQKETSQRRFNSSFKHKEKRRTNKLASGPRIKHAPASVVGVSSSVVLEREFCMVTGYIPKEQSFANSMDIQNFANQGGIQIYSQLHYWDQVGSLRAMLPVTAKHAGDTWLPLVNSYIESKKGHTYAACQLSRSFVDFLHNCSSSSAIKPGIKDLAELECTMLELNLSPVVAALATHEPLSNKAQLSELRPVINPLLELREFNWPVPALMQALINPSGKVSAQSATKTQLLIFREPLSLNVNYLYATPVAFEFVRNAGIEDCCYLKLINTTLTHFAQPETDDQVVSFLPMINCLIERRVIVGSETANR